MNKPLPHKLGKEPIIDVVFELRFEATAPASALLPGLIFPLIKHGTPSLEPMPASHLPLSIREQDPGLRYVALMKIQWDEKFFILIGDRVLAVSCNMPYPGWAEFKTAIIEILQVLKSASFIKKIDRHSLKYVDIFKNDNQKLSGFDRFDVALRIGARDIHEEVTQIRTEISEPPFLHAVTILTSAVVNTTSGEQLAGALLDVDTHRIQEFADPNEFVDQLSPLLEDMHTASKAIFFSCISEIGLKELEPHYE